MSVSVPPLGSDPDGSAGQCVDRNCRVEYGAALWAPEPRCGLHGRCRLRRRYSGRGEYEPGERKRREGNDIGNLVGKREQDERFVEQRRGADCLASKDGGLVAAIRGSTPLSVGGGF